jgi:hypothetical protein
MTVAASSRPRRAIIALTALAFLTLISLPLADALFHVAPAVNIMEPSERREAQAETGLPAILDRFNALRYGYLDRTFGFRSLLVKWQNYLVYCLLGTSSSEMSVLAGPDGWLFLAKESRRLNAIDDFRGTRLFSPHELAVWTAEFRARRDWLKSQGMAYLVVMAPNKQTIYPEKLPPGYNQVGPTRTDQLVTALHAAGIEVLDLRQPLLDRKKTDQVYYLTDSHWTPAGVETAYAEILAAVNRLVPLGPEAAPRALSNTPARDGGGDLGHMLGLCGDCFPERQVISAPQGGSRAVPADAQRHANPTDIMPAAAFERPGSGLPRALFLRDSFFQSMMPLLSEHFSRVAFVWPTPSSHKGFRRFDREVILAERPDIVVDEIAERYFIVPPPDGL